jgi:hypothetical protein
MRTLRFARDETNAGTVSAACPLELCIKQMVMLR